MSIAQVRYRSPKPTHVEPDGTPENALWRAIRDKDDQAVMAALREGADPAMSLGKCGGALAWAVGGPNFNAVMLLLDAGADPNAANEFGWTPLSLAIGSDCGERDKMVSALLEYKADPCGYGPDGENHLIFAARKQRDVCVRLLLGAGADPKAASKKGSYTPLMWASYFNKKQMVMDLIVAGADVEALGEDGRLAREWSAVSVLKSQEVVHILDVTSVKVALVKEVAQVSADQKDHRPPRL